MFWSYSGFLVTSYVIWAVLGLQELQRHSNPSYTVFRFFVIIPGLFAIIIAEPIVTFSKVQRRQVRHAFDRGDLTAGRVFRDGSLIAVVSFVLAVAMWFGLKLLTENLRWLRWGALCPAFLGGVLAAAWPVTLAEKASPEEGEDDETDHSEQSIRSSDRA